MHAISLPSHTTPFFFLNQRPCSAAVLVQHRDRGATVPAPLPVTELSGHLSFGGLCRIASARISRRFGSVSIFETDFSWTVAHHTQLKSVQRGGYRKLSSGGGFFFFFCEMRFKRPKSRSYRTRQYHESAPRFSLERNGCNSDTRNHGDRVQPLSPVWDAPMFLSALSSATFSDDPECGQTESFLWQPPLKVPVIDRCITMPCIISV